MWRAARAFWTQPSAETWAPYNLHCKQHYNTTRAPDADDAQARIVFNTDILFASASGEQQSMNLLPGLAAVRCPVLVMAGALDPVCPLADAQDIAAAIPAPWGRLASFAASGHGAWRDEPEAAFALLREFVAAPMF